MPSRIPTPGRLRSDREAEVVTLCGPAPTWPGTTHKQGGRFPSQGCRASPWASTTEKLLDHAVFFQYIFILALLTEAFFPLNDFNVTSDGRNAKGEEMMLTVSSQCLLEKWT